MIAQAEPTSSTGGKVSIADFATSDLFADVPESILMECAARAQLVRFPRGSILAREGDPADAMYILLTGSVEVVVERAGEADLLVDILRAGECLGDLALLLGQRRTATARAVRDCSAARIDAEDFAWLLEKAPGFTIRLARAIADRLQRTTRRLVRKKPIEKIATLSTSSGIAVESFCAGLEEACAQCPPAGRSRPIEIAAISGLNETDQHAFAILGEADLIFVVGDSSQRPETERIRALLDAIADFRPRPEVHLALLQRSDPPYRGTLSWLRDRRIKSWHHVRPNKKEDFNRAVRRITGQAVGVALSGGGARGFAHIGILKAIAEAQIPIDFIAGSSMGAIVAAQHAMGFSIDSMLDLMHRSYVKKSGFPDFTIPYVALYTGAGTSRRLKDMFGQSRIEDLQTPYFCVSSNLNTAETVVHETGKLWHATRSSCSVPGLLPPIRTRRGLLVDGGLLDNLPVVAMSERLNGRIIASDVSVAVESQRPADNSRRWRRLSFSPPSRLPRIGYILMRSAQLASVRDARQAGVPADLYLHPPVDDVGMSDFGRLHEIVDRAATYAQSELARWSR